MTALDITVLLLVGGLAVLGGLRGFTSEVLSLAAWIAVIFALKLLHDPATQLLEEPVGTHAGAAVLSFGLIAVVVLVGGKILANAIGGSAKRSVLGPIDRLLGFGFGAVKGLIAATLAFLLFNLGYDTLYGTRADRPDWLATSRTYPLLNASGRAIVDFVAARRRLQATEDNAAEG